MSLYTYTKLNIEKEEIRLIKLMPGNWDDALSCSIFHAPLVRPEPDVSSKRFSIDELCKTLPEDWTVGETLDGRYLFMNLGDGPNSWDHPNAGFDPVLYRSDPPKMANDYDPKYEALSYTWGSPKHVAQLRVIGHIPTVIPVGANLAAALQHLRHSNRPRTLWVDAICINQNDVLERNHEVKRMTSIYSLAERTTIWLGEEADDSTLALTTLEHFSEQVEFMNNDLYGDAPGAEHLVWWNPFHQLPYDAKIYSSLISLFQRPWFSRVWVLQEALLGSRISIVQCGSVSLFWANLRKAMLVFRNNITIPRNLRLILTSHCQGLFPLSSADFPVLLQWVKQHQCTDPRDKIYGLLGLVPRSLSDDTVVDYSAPVAKVYQDFMLSHLSLFKDLRLLLHCRISQCLPTAPSWVQNWAVHDDRIEIERATGRRPAGNSSAVTKYCAPDVLEATGICCATISTVDTIESSNSKDIFQVIYQRNSEDFLGKRYITGELLIDAAIEVTVRGLTIERHPTNSRCVSLEKIRSNFFDSNLAQNLSEEILLNHNDEYLGPVSVFTTIEGYLGVTYPGAKKNDFVCVLLGCNCPMLLRPISNGGFKVVGPCYVHGLMDGEALLGPIPIPWRLQISSNGVTDWNTYFVKSDLKTLNDPRLPPLPPHWEEIGRDISESSSSKLRFRNKDTGEKTRNDPRILPEALEARGVKLERFKLL